MTDILYKKSTQINMENDFVNADDDDDGIYESDPESDSEYDNAEGFDDVHGFDVEKIRPNIYLLLAKVRKIIKMFRNSPVKDSLLQSYIQVKHGKQLSLVLDCRTRWNSMLPMIERFIQVNGSIQDALIELNITDTVEQNEIDILKQLSACLHPIKLAVEALCRRGSNLIKADAVLKFCLTNLNNK